ncbi:MAG TPA: ABC transporter ATP-binding protein [Trebonia sp.]|nr:ABC transporter ATP-binding protein [Trebonia sp.]
MSTPVLEARDLGKNFLKGERYIVALRGLSLAVEDGSFVCVLGRSGSGKSTLLNMMAGLLRPTEGQVRYRGQPVAGPNPTVGYLTQADTLMPWRDVRRNIEMPLEIRGMPRAARRARAAELISAVGLRGFESHYPRELSGGMRRRASLARMLSSEPDTLLLDEPFGALDAYLRREMQDELLRLWSGSGRTVVFVTHDIEEALVLSDRVVLLGALGRIVADVEVGLPRPRDSDELRVDERFVALHRQLSAALKEAAAS